MEIKIVWTKRAEKGLCQTLIYLEKHWTKKEILHLEQNIESFINRIKQHPLNFSKTTNYKNLHKGMVDENNYIVYRVYPRKKQITIINFRGAKQNPIY